MGHFKRPLPDADFGSDQPACLKINLLQPDIHMLRIILPFRRNTVTGVVHLAVFIEEQRGINPRSILQPDRIGPVTGRISGGDIEVMLVFVIVYIGRNHIKDSLVIAQRRRPDAHGGNCMVKIQL
ncbi:hypothetical protein D3C80_1855240 [compost metagenome]